MDFDESVIEKIQNILQARTEKKVERVNGNHKLLFGRGIIFRISPIGSTHVFVIFRKTFFEQNDTRCLELAEILSQKVKHIHVGEPHVIEIDSQVHIERPQKAYRLSSK